MKSFHPIDVKPLKQYQLLITFNNKERRIFDVAPYLNDDYFRPLRNQSVFRTAKVNSLTVEWVGGIDICPDELYYNSKPQEN